MKKILVGIVIGLSLLSASVFAQETEQSVLKKIQKEFPNLNATKVTYLSEVKLYEVRVKTDKSLSFTNANLDYFILNGQIIDPKSKNNVSTDRDMVVVKDFFNGLPFNKSIPLKFGTGQRRIAIFTDPDCPYCKATDQAINNEMTKDNITINYFMNPLNIPGHENAPEKARKIWCSPDKTLAWRNWMLGGILPTNPGTCANPVADTKQLSTENGFNSTPTLVFDNGFVWRGQITPTQIREILNKKLP